MNKLRLSLALVALSIILGLAVYPSLVDDVGFWGVFALPIASACVLTFMHYIPTIDPLRKNVSKFADEYENFKLVVITFLVYAYILTVFDLMGTELSVAGFLSPGVAILMYYSGVLCTKTKRNWFIGIKTPWTLSSDKVWDATHGKVGQMFQYAAIFPLFGIIFPDYLVFLIIIPVFALVIYSGIFSYREYEKK